MKVLTKAKLPIKIWADEEDIQRQSLAIDQAENLANHPLVEKWVALLPDFHGGYGMPIGGAILLADGVLPYAIGNDIGCGVLTAKTDIEAASISREQWQQWREKVHATVPVGNAQHKEPQKGLADNLFPDERERVTFRGARSAVAQAYVSVGAYQLGTLGGGNHFIEAQVDDEGYLYIMVHSGSRGMGGEVCNTYYRDARKLMESFKIKLPDPQLAFLPRDIARYDQYMAEMNWCLRYAEMNRQRMLAEAVWALPFADFAVTDQFDCRHNFAQMEHHFGKNYLVVRKGAVEARAGQRVAIPGSMGTATYVGEGLGNAESFNTCSHGAGRIASRKVANAMVTHEQAVESMKHVVFGVRQGNYDEFPHAYKDVNKVMAAQVDLVKPVKKLSPLAVVKG